MWHWIEKTPKEWAFLARVIIKALILFALCNLIFALIYPMEILGKLSLYNNVLPTRLRLPYGENPSQSYNITLNNIPAMFASHSITRAKAEDEFRIVLIGDSATWGWLLENEETVSAQLNQLDLSINHRHAMVYNLGYPVMSLTKDLLILDEALHYEPDMIIWLVSLASFPPEKQRFPPLVQNNYERLLPLIETYSLAINPDDEQLIQPIFWERTIVGQRRSLADLLHLQSYGFSWMATGIDQYIPEEIDLRRSDFDHDYSWEGYENPVDLSQDELAFDILLAGIAHAGDVPVMIINEPMFISDGLNSDIRYNSLYPHWAYDKYRNLLAEIAEENAWQYHDLWNRIASDQFTDTPVHLTAQGTQELAQMISEIIQSERQYGRKNCTRNYTTLYHP
jgi:lysophospholipase L1-like esterase